MLRPVVRVLRSVWRASGTAEGERVIPEETAVAITYNTASYAVMMATPQDLEDFAIGFSLTEGVIPSVDAIDYDRHRRGGDGRRASHLAEGAATPLEFLGRRRKMAGPTGCGLCGVESLVEAMRPPPQVGEGRVFTPDQIMAAVESLLPLQVLNRRPVRCMRPASGSRSAAWSRSVRMSAATTRSTSSPALSRATAQAARSGLVVLTSRVSVEMVQKSATIGAPVLVAVSAPTALAVRMAEACGMTLVAIARKDGFEIFTHPQRVEGELATHVA